MKKMILILTMLAALFAIGCSKADNYSERMYGRTTTADMGRSVVAPLGAKMAYNDMSYNEAVVMHDSIRLTESGGGGSHASLINTERKLIKNAYIRIRVEKLDAADATIAELISKYDAYSASTEAGENSRHYSLRVPASHYDNFLAEMDGMGRLLNRSESTEDVTLRYFDLEGRLEMKRTLLRTFQTYLTRARTIEEILSVEARIAELQNDIEATGTQLRYLANSVDYATINLNLVGPVAAAQKQNETLGERIKQLFSSFGDFLSTIAVVIIGIVIFGIPLVILLTILFWLLFGKVGLMRKLWGLVREKK